METAVERVKLLGSVRSLLLGLSMPAWTHLLAGVEASALPSPTRQAGGYSQPPLAALPCSGGMGSAASAGSCLLPCTRPWHPMAWPCTSLLPIARVPCESKEKGLPRLLLKWGLPPLPALVMHISRALRSP